MTGLINFRDVGGLSFERGRVRPDILYRCGHLADLNAEDRGRIAELDLQLIIDLRFRGEQRSEVSGWPEGYADRILCHDRAREGVAPHVQLLRSGSVTTAMVRDHYLRVYRTLPFDPVYRPLFALAAERFANGTGRALVHCSAGKDRTGMLVALILEALGVPRSQILEDFMRSAGDPRLAAMAGPMQDAVRRNHGVHASTDVLAALLTVQPAYLMSMFDELDRQYQTVDSYFAASGLPADIGARLQARLIEPEAGGSP